MSSPVKSDRGTLKRSASKRASYVDLTADSDADEDEVMPLQESSRSNQGTKRKRVGSYLLYLMSHALNEVN